MNHRERYDAAMAHAGEVWADFTNALRRAEFPAEVTQTGGMCLAITWPGPGGRGFYLMTTREDSLPWEGPDPDDGLLVGWYPDPDQSGCEEYLATDVQTPAEAVRLAVEALAFARPRER